MPLKISKIASKSLSVSSIGTIDMIGNGVKSKSNSKSKMMKNKGSMGRVLQGPWWLVKDLEKIQGFVFSKQKLCGSLKERLEMLKNMKKKAKGEVQSCIFIFDRKIMYDTWC